MSELQEIYPTESPRIIDIVAETGIDVSPWEVNEDGRPCEIPASNPQYCYEWCFRDFSSRTLLLNLWYDEMVVTDGAITQELNLRQVANEDENSSRRRRAANMDSAIRVASFGGWKIRVMVLLGKDTPDGKQETKARMLDPVEWQIEEYNEDSGTCILSRKDAAESPKPPKSKDWTREELKASVEAYMVMRSKFTAGTNPVKVEAYRELAERFGRTESSYDFGMQNISYVLSLQGRVWVKGLPPAPHVDTNIIREIEELLAEYDGKPVERYASFESKVDEARRRKKTHPPLGNHTPALIENTSSTYQRDPEVVAWVLNNAAGKCEACGASAPFERDDGSLFLEVHHVVRLADKGPDTVENAIAACPNCHRALHYASDKTKRREDLYKSINRLKRPIVGLQ